MSSPDITVTIVFHQEGAYVKPALASFYDMVDMARSAEIVVEANAILDQPDDVTRHLVAASGNWLDTIREVSHGDLGNTRNDAARFASGRYLAFLDGDDLWGEEWIRSAFAAATSPDSPVDAIWHPAWLFYFYETDFWLRSESRRPHAGARSFHMVQMPSISPSFDKRALLLNNVWTANVFARREVYLKYPYEAAERQIGFGVEDWMWNIKTVCNHLPHLVVPDTVHLIRQKEVGSLSQRNMSEGLLPQLPANFDAIFHADEPGDRSAPEK
jgi:glycosyltransferase involved in cell wall biosynthesis